MIIKPSLVAAIGVAALAFACGAGPAELDVQAADATSTPPPAAASVPAVDAGGAASTDALPPGHPPLDGTAAAHAAPGAGAMPPGHPPLDGSGSPSANPALPPNHPPMPPPAGANFKVPAPPSTAGQGQTALAWQTPAGWTSEQPASSLRRAQYKVPGPGGDAECVVFYFGPGQGGDPKANAERWAAQFLDDKGQPTIMTMKTRVETLGVTKVMFVETAGTYLAGSMTGPGSIEKKPGYALLGAIAEGPDANWFFKLTGPQATVEAARPGFGSMIASLKRGA